MKSLIFFIIFLCNILFASAQSTATITGKLLSPRQPYMVLYYERSLGFEKFADTIQLDAENNFNYTWKFDPPFVAGGLSVNPNYRIQLWTTDQKDLNITIGDSIQSSMFSGDHQRILHYLNIQSKIDKRSIEEKFYSRNPTTRYNDSLDNFNYYLLKDSIAIEQNELAEKFFDSAKKITPTIFLDYYRNMVSFHNLEEKLDDPDAPLKLIPLQSLFKVPDSIRAFPIPASWDITDTFLYKNSSMHFFLRHLLFRTNFALKKQNPYAGVWNWDSVYANIFRTIDKMEKPGTFPNSFLKAVFINKEIALIDSRPYKEDTTEAIYQKYTDIVTDDPLLQRFAGFIRRNLAEQFNKLGSLRRGVPAPVVPLLDEKLNTLYWQKFKGKTIYLDVWASWCSPCISEIPNWNKLVERYKEDDRVAFVTISIDDTEKAWKGAIKKYKPLGKHLLSLGGFESAFARSFNIRSVPKNIIIGPDGKMVQQRAERASEINLEEVLKRHHK